MGTYLYQALMRERDIDTAQLEKTPIVGRRFLPVVDLILISGCLCTACDKRDNVVKSVAEIVDFVIVDLDKPICFDLLGKPRSAMISIDKTESK